jgi:hypothetical protein
MPNSKPANDVISEYLRWKQQGEDLRAHARQAMEARFRELLAEAVRIAQDYRADFGAPLKPPPAVTAFRFKSGGRPKPRKAAEPTPAPPKPKEDKPAPKPDRKTLGLQKRLETARKKLDAAKSAGTPTRNLEDKVYEIEDELRLAAQ